MLRTRIMYGGHEYSVPGQDADAVRREIEGALESKELHWLKAVFGAGRGEEAALLITASIPVALVTEAPDDTSEPEAPGQTNPSLESD